jgi:hypothetical protein
MKTTLDLPEDLLIEAKSLAARRRTTLKLLVENALRRELKPVVDLSNPDPDRFEVGPFGILRLKARPGPPLTVEFIRSLQDEIDQEEMRRASGEAPP